MIPQTGYVAHPDTLSSKEFKRLLLIRRETLDIATTRAMGGQPMPIPWRRGWKATLAILGRDRDGSVKARITCTGQRPSMTFVRSVRLVRPQSLTVDHTARVAREAGEHHDEKRSARPPYYE